jgi:hypothetical protein
MSKKYLFVFLLCVLIPSVVVFAQAESKRGGDFWICPFGETAFYGIKNAAFGGGFAFGYGSGISIGLKAALFASTENTSTLELNFLFRVYLSGSRAYSGPFLQFAGGPAVFAQSGGIKIPSELGMIQAGLSFGWRFLFFNRWFIEPAVRGGYPYIAGAGLSAGVRF